jgi:hypothetical protein
MSTTLNGDADIEQMEAALKDAAADLEVIAHGNTQLMGEFEGHGWSGLDALSGAQAKISGIRDNLIAVADKIGVGGRIVREAHLNNHMIGHASKESLGHA